MENGIPGRQLPIVPEICHSHKPIPQDRRCGWGQSCPKSRKSFKKCTLRQPGKKGQMSPQTTRKRLLAGTGLLLFSTAREWSKSLLGSASQPNILSPTMAGSDCFIEMCITASNRLGYSAVCHFTLPLQSPRFYPPEFGVVNSWTAVSPHPPKMWWSCNWLYKHKSTDFSRTFARQTGRSFASFDNILPSQWKRP